MRGKILDEAKEVINGERQDQYGNPEDSFKGIAGRWGRYLGLEITPVQVAHMMVEFKLERECHNPKRDNLRDAAGYLEIKADLLKELEPRFAYKPAIDPVDFENSFNKLKDLESKIDPSNHPHPEPFHVPSRKKTASQIANDATWDKINK